MPEELREPEPESEPEPEATSAPEPEPEPEPEEDAAAQFDQHNGESPTPPAQSRNLFGFPLHPQMPQPEEYPLTVGEAIAEVTRRVPHIAKDRRASQGGSYAYRGIDDVLEALHPLLGDVGLVIMPGRAVREVWETRATSSGGTLNVARLLVRYRFIGPDGSRTSAEVWGEGADSGDKATQKAMSQAYKSLCLQTFSIPTEASAADDPDATNPAAAPPTPEQVHRARQAWAAAADADSYERLAQIRNQASREGLLGITVVQPPGAVVGDAALGALFDLRRAELEGAGQ